MLSTFRTSMKLLFFWPRRGLRKLHQKQLFLSNHVTITLSSNRRLFLSPSSSFSFFFNCIVFSWACATAILSVPANYVILLICDRWKAKILHANNCLSAIVASSNVFFSFWFSQHSRFTGTTRWLQKNWIKCNIEVWQVESPSRNLIGSVEAWAYICFKTIIQIKHCTLRFAGE